MKKVCVITAARSDYGPLRWIIDGVKNCKKLQLQLLVTGGHLSIDQGLTYKHIENDGYYIDEKVEMLISSESAVGVVKSMGVCSIGIADALHRLSPDMIIVLGDRYELIPICSAALVMNIPIAHISGGDVTEGAIDNEIRNAITMMASIHFPGVEESAIRIRQMRNSNQSIFVVGEPGLENFLRLPLLSREHLANDLGLEIDRKWILVTLHPETKLSIEKNISIAKNIIKEIILHDDFQVIITKANSDVGGSQINSIMSELTANDPSKFKLVSSLGQIRYLSIMKQAFCMIGNSSSGIIEAPFIGVHVINIGHRQEGRYISNNVISISGSQKSIKDSFKIIHNTSKKNHEPDYYYGDGNTSNRIVKHILSYLYNQNAKNTNNIEC